MFTFRGFQALVIDMLNTLARGALKLRTKEHRALKNVIVLRTHDEVNVAWARLWCDRLGLVLQQADQRDALFPAGAGLAIDLDHLGMDAKERAAFVRRLAIVPLPYPVAVASYDLDAEMKRALKAQGVLLFRRVGRHLFHELAKAIGSAPARSATVIEVAPPMKGDRPGRRFARW
jgi:hypothetical protein